MRELRWSMLSEVLGEAAESWLPAAGGLDVREKPQLVQNFAPGGFKFWQFGQIRGNAFPQFWQKFAFSGFWKVQFGQIIS